jgi:hypothetical protein
MPPPPPQPNIRVNASAVAKLCGFNPFVDQLEAIEELKLSLAGDHQLAKAKAAFTHTPLVDLVESAKALDTPAGREMARVEKAVAHEAPDRAALAKRTAAEALAPQLRLEVHRDMARKSLQAEAGDTAASNALAALPIQHEVEQTRRMAAGTLREKSVAEDIKNLFDNFRSTPPVRTMAVGDVLLVGRADALAEDKVIEIKVRRARFLGAPLYERVQLEVYMRLYDLPSGVLVEQFQDRLAHHEMVRDDALWFRISESLAEVARLCQK